MKETVANEYSRVGVEIPRGAELFDGRTVRARSQIVWGEHCSECAYPICYASCAFYDPRPDLHCRRFVAGIEAAEQGLTRIRFRKWGKLEGHGPAPLHAYVQARRRERRDAMVSQFLADAPLPFALSRNAVWRWNTRKSHNSRSAPNGSPTNPAFDLDAFVVEGWSLDGSERGFTLTFLQDAPERGTHQTHFRLGSEARRLTVPASEIAAAIRLDQPYLIQIEPVGEAEGVDVVFGLTDFVAFAEAPVMSVAPSPPSSPLLAKVLVWDLDETLWTGVLAEDGPDGVRPRPEAMAAIKALDARGLLQSIASKNDAAEGLEALRRHGLTDYFLHPEINWGPKSQSIGRIAQRLDLGLDSFVFIDDQPFERAEVQAGQPKVRTLTHVEVEGLLSHPWFDHPITPEGAKRRSLYQAEAQRTVEMEAQGDDYLGFLRASDLVLDARPLGRADVARTHELSQRTNQLNFTGAKFALDRVARMVEPEARYARLTLRCTDRYGDYGLIGFAELDLEAGELVEFFMSCRVQRKRVEHAAFAHLAERLGAAGHAVFRVRFQATERNGASVRLLEELGFARDEDGWVRDLADPFVDSDVVRLVRAASEAA
ncbi:MAG: HAD-IIIC family phosphatase [Caulobacteraceae bacterium]